MTYQQGFLVIATCFFVIVVIFVSGWIQRKRKAKEVTARTREEAEKMLSEYKRIAKERKQEIAKYVPEFGKEACIEMLNYRIRPGFTARMVVITWGRPNKIDQKVTLKSGLSKFRYVYGEPRTPDVTYVYFKDDEVVKIEGETYRPEITPEMINALEEVVKEAG